MARFRFGLQSVLDIKLKMETQAKQDFASAVAVLDTQQRILNGLYEKRESLHQEAIRLRSGNLDFRDIEDNELSRQLNEQAITSQKVNVKRAEDNVELARTKMADAMKERKTYELLREKAFALFMQEENKAESKAIDELTSFTYGQKKARNL